MATTPDMINYWDLPPPQGPKPGRESGKAFSRSDYVKTYRPPKTAAPDVPQDQAPEMIATPTPPPAQGKAPAVITTPSSPPTHDHAQGELVENENDIYHVVDGEQDFSQTIIDLIYGRCREDSIISVGSFSDGGDLLPFWPVKVSEMHDLLPGIVEQLEITRYVMLNTLKPWPRALTTRYKGKRYQPLFKTNWYHIRELNAITLDLDVGRTPPRNMPAAKAITAVKNLAYDGAIPYPSMTALSGQGAYAIWFLRELESNHPPLRNRENVHQWKLATGELMKRLASLYPDQKSLSINQFWSAPGTWKNINGQDTRVLYEPTLVQGNDGVTRVPVYTIKTMLKSLNVLSAETLLPPEPKRLKAGGRTPTERRGTKKADAPWNMRWQEIVRIAHHRGSIPQGNRNMVVLYYFSARFFAIEKGPVYLDYDEIFERARADAWEFNVRYCAPPLARHGKDGIHHATFKPYKARNTTVATVLGVTVEEAVALSLESLLPREMREIEQEEAVRQASRRKQKHLILKQGVWNGDTTAEITTRLIDAEFFPNDKKGRAAARTAICRTRSKWNMPVPGRPQGTPLLDHTEQARGNATPTTDTTPPAAGDKYAALDAAILGGWKDKDILAHPGLREKGFTIKTVESRRRALGGP